MREKDRRASGLLNSDQVKISVIVQHRLKESQQFLLLAGSGLLFAVALLPSCCGTCAAAERALLFDGLIV
ncbi:hypothetical protein [Herbaspirillum lusitanum]|uniref:hypothetical protein n=1 Tax=Herbaspirillum lusitanum TaxID=213312 RepID=UPI0012F4CCB3|nr:hypothetical protein [Herbaspirillum lusitanum]